MALKTARFRISIKDNLTGRALKIELIDWVGSRFSIRQNGLRATRMPEANISTVCAQLRRWMVRHVKTSRRIR